MKLFTAVEIDRATGEQAAQLADELRRRVNAERPQARVTWIPAERLHVTVRFIGTVDLPQATLIGETLRVPLDIRTFDLSIAGVGAFAERGSPRVIWAGVDEGIEALREVAREIDARLEACGVRLQERDYRPHLTLARVREAAGLRAASLLDGLGATRLGRPRVEAVTLFESRSSPKGPTYVPLQRTLLRWKN